MLWAHYKSVLFEEIQKQLPSQHDFHVLQIAKNEISRKKMESGNLDYVYNYTLLFDDYIENVPKLKEIIAVLKFVIKYNPDVINVTGYSASISTLPVIFLAKLLGKKIVMSNESTDSDKRSGGLKERIKRWAVQACSGFVVFGKSSEDYLIKLGAKKEDILVKNAAVVDNKALEVIYYAAKYQTLFTEIKTNKNFVFVGRISEEKNVKMLVSAFQNLENRGKEWGLIIVGNGPNEENLHLQINQKPENIYKYDAVGWKEIPKFFSKSDCFVLPSISEPWGLVVNEAMVCSLAIIVSQACGCAEDLVKDNGYIVKTSSETDLQKAMQQIMDSENLVIMKSNSKDIIKGFSVEKVAKDYVQKITALL